MAKLPTPTKEDVPSTNILDAVYAGAMLDKVVTSRDLTYEDRFGEEHYTMEGIRQNLIPLSRQYMTLADAQADIANIPDGSATYVRSTDGSSLADEYINNGGTLVATGRAMPSLRTIKNGRFSWDAKGIAEVTENLVIYGDGSSTTDSSWLAYFVPVKNGDVITYSGTVGSGVVGEQIAYLIQVDINKDFVEPLSYYTSTGSIIDTAELQGTASQDGYIYVRVRNDAEFELSKYSKYTLLESDIDVNDGVTSYENYLGIINNAPLVDVTDADSTGWITGRVIYADGMVSDAIGSEWRAAYVPVRQGDRVEYHGEIGSLTAGEEIAYLVQLDSALNVVENLTTYTSSGVRKNGVISGTATQDGFVYVRVRATIPAASVYRTKPLFTPGADPYSVRSQDDVAGSNRTTVSITPETAAVYLPGRVMGVDGTVVDNAGEQWRAVYIAVNEGDVIQYRGVIGTAVSGQTSAHIIQLDDSMEFVGVIAEFTSAGGTPSAGNMIGIATQDGYVYVRERVTDVVATITKTSQLYAMASADAIDGYDSDTHNRITRDITTADDTYTVQDRVVYLDGSVTNAAVGQNAVYVPVKKGDVVRLTGQFGSGTADEKIAYLSQLDVGMNFVAPLQFYTSPGSTVMGSISAKAEADGFIYARARRADSAGTEIPYTVEKTSAEFVTEDDARGEMTSEDLTAREDLQKKASVMYSGGSVVSGAAYAIWTMYYIPVHKGDAIDLYGALGSAKVGELIAYIMQCDANKDWVEDLYVFTSGGSTVLRSARGIATRDGFVAVRVRTGADINPVVSRTRWNRLARLEDLTGVVEGVRAQLAKKAEVFRAPYHVDMSGLPERNPDFSSFGDPLSYTFHKQWARRDFYNAADSYMLSFMDLENNPWNSQSNIYDIADGSVFSYSWAAGEVSFRNPTANGRTVMFADRYLPFATSEIAISRLSGNATLGIMFSDVGQLNSVSVRVSNSQVICEVYGDGAILDTTTFTGSDMEGAVLQAQNTGLALILKKVNADGTWVWIGRYDYRTILDARKVTFLDTWKTYVFAQTDDFTTGDVATFSGFSNRLASGSNSVSIRFLTYEDGTFIQRGNWLYFLVEGTGTTISDLYTQIVRINFNSGEVQMVGAIFQVRTDGTDEDVVLGDDSIKAVYDRNSKSWKGISCGMDYQGTEVADNYRPKLFFETKQDLLQGGVIIVKNSVQMKNADGSGFGVGSAYVEDIDFYYDEANSEWVLTGNSVSSGCKTFRSPTLFDGVVQEFATAEVPTGVRDTGNQFVHFGATTYLTSGGTANKLHLRKYEAGLTYLGEFTQDVYLAPNTTGPWCTLVPFTNGDETALYMLSFDRSDLYEGLGNGAATYDHGGLYCWKCSIK